MGPVGARGWEHQREAGVRDQRAPGISPKQALLNEKKNVYKKKKQLSDGCLVFRMVQMFALPPRRSVPTLALTLLVFSSSSWATSGPATGC